MHPFLAWARNHRAEMETSIQELVECESPSDSARDVNRCVDLLVTQAGKLARAKTFRANGRGHHLLLDFKLSKNARRRKERLLGLGHSDTVWPLGTLKHMPFRKSRERLFGPGVLDMKTGLMMFLYAARLLHELDVPIRRQISLLVVSDEEVGSPTSRTLTENEARQSACVFVMEPGAGLTGKLKTARKGIGNYRMRISGRASHAGVDFEKGASAVVEAAHQILRCAKMTDLSRGVTVNPGVVNGGTRSNVIAAEAEIDIDVRVVKMTQARRLDAALRKARAVNSNCQVRVEGGLNRPPMERTPAIARLFNQARDLGKELGLDLEESSTGGGSDGNFTAALGIPTLDGLGAVGEGAHAANESILLQPLAARTALLASLLAHL